MTMSDNMDGSDLSGNGWNPAKSALAWHGWGSPVGLGIFLICAGLFMLLLRYAFFGMS
jgi:hypothetical protein